MITIILSYHTVVLYSPTWKKREYLIKLHMYQHCCLRNQNLIFVITFNKNFGDYLLLFTSPSILWGSEWNSEPGGTR